MLVAVSIFKVLQEYWTWENLGRGTNMKSFWSTPFVGPKNDSEEPF